MNIIKWLTKISLISLVAVSPLIYLTYLSGEIMNREMLKYTDHTEITAIDESTADIELLNDNVNLAYYYTFIIFITIFSSYRIFIISLFLSIICLSPQSNPKTTLAPHLPDP